MDGQPSFTAGPWSYTLGDVMRVSTRDGFAGCGVHRIGKHAGFGNEALWAANARLIAAAPELYEAARVLRARLSAFVGAVGDITDCSADVDAMTLADAAFSKVEGR